MGKTVKPRRQCGSDGSGNKEGEAERQREDIGGDQVLISQDQQKQQKSKCECQGHRDLVSYQVRGRSGNKKSCQAHQSVPGQHIPCRYRGNIMICKERNEVG